MTTLTNNELATKLLEPDVSRETLREAVRRITGRVEPLPEAVQTALPGIGSESPLVALQDVPHATLARGESNADSDWHEAAVSSVSAYAQMGVRSVRVRNARPACARQYPDEVR